MLSGVASLSAFSRIVLLDFKIVFKPLGAWVWNSSALFIQEKAVGKIKSSFLDFKPSDMTDLFLKLYNLDKYISSSFNSFLNYSITSAIGCE